jgi:hypothetical protein
MRIFLILLTLSGCGGTPDFYDEGGYCWARVYYDGQRVIVTDDYTAYPGPCE